jgi:hypothetical protein
VGLFRRRRETLNEKLMREAGLSETEVETEVVQEPQPPRPTHDGAIGIPRPREFDALTVVDAVELEGDAVEFVALSDGDLIVVQQEGDGDLSPLADAVEERLKPPYRARGVRHTDTLWSVAAIPVDVVRLEAEGDSIEVALHNGEHTATLDGEPTLQRFAELERLGQSVGANYVVRAERLDDDLWQARATAL